MWNNFFRVFSTEKNHGHARLALGTFFGGWGGGGGTDFGLVLFYFYLGECTLST